ncbi:MAG TPA: hypothetical protein ENF95_00635 [Candidatus Aenigmarchaeota archaeon]|nr:hypothetical protein [Candidatus Aenigmarchaeota archaeon]
MKEPLKGKVRYHDYPEFGGNPESCFKFEDVKGAVEGLLEEIEKTSFKLRIEIKKKKNMNKDYIIGFADGLLYSKKFIKKWFSDVLER